MLEIGEMPDYITTEFILPESAPKHKDLEFEVLKARYISYNTKVERFREGITRLFGDIQIQSVYRPDPKSHCGVRRGHEGAMPS